MNTVLFSFLFACTTDKENADEICDGINNNCDTDDLIDENAIDGVFHVGDISYAEGFLSVWDEYLSQIEPFASRRPYMLNLGNHEQDSPLDTFKKGQAVTIFNVRRHRASPFPPFAHPYPPFHMPQTCPWARPLSPPSRHLSDDRA